MKPKRRPANDRILGALWGAVVTATGIMMVFVFSGYAIDIELVSIVALVVIGGWLALSAAFAGRSRDRIAATPASFTDADTDVPSEDATPTR